jgi:RNA polymerase sigma factor (sigma-70 family)
MSSTSLPLMQLFMERRQQLRRKLKHLLGSEELANDALQETYLRLERMNEGDVVPNNPLGYLFRMALNAAADQRQMEARYLTGGELDDLLDMGTDLLDPARVADGQFEVEALADALSELPQRRRAILIAARVEDVSLQTLAERYAISVRTVSNELKRALEHCAERLDRKFVQRFGPGAGKES